MNAIDYPTISVGTHKNLVVRFSLAAQVLMQRRGIDPNRLHSLTCPFIVVDGKVTTDINPNAIGNILTIFSCMVAENFIDPQSTRVSLDAAPTADYWATLLDDRISEVDKTIAQSLGKASEARRAKLAAVPPQEQAS